MKLLDRIYVELRLMLEITIELLFNMFNIRNRCESLTNAAGKVVVITGANTGIGKVTAQQLCKYGAKVIIGCRDVEKGNKCVKEIINENPNADIKMFKLDLCSLASVRQFAQQINQEVTHIDVLINNAGVMMTPKWQTEDGFEMQIGTNHLGHFLLTLLLIDKFKKSESARIVNVSSIVHMNGEIDFDDINLDKKYTPYQAYGRSKLANVLFTRELAKRLSETNIKAYALHPGLIRTELSRHLTGVKKFFVALISSVFLISVDLGAQTNLYCATEPKLNNETGFYYRDCKRVDNLTANATDDVCARKLWKWSCDSVQLEDRLRLE